jgi:thiol-disulfide isomerase/thioredoxin
MTTKLKLTAFVFCMSFIVQAQTLSGDYQGYLYKNYYIGKYEKGKYVLIDSLQVDPKGMYTKQLDSTIYTPNTLYVIASEFEYKENKNISNPHPHNSIRFVYMGSDISYQTSWRQETGYLKFIKGGAPTDHIKELNIRLEKTQSLLTQMEQLLEQLEVTDPFYKRVMKSYAEKATVYNNYCQSIAAQYPKGTYMNVYALMFQQVVPKKKMSFKDFQTYRAKNLFQFTDLKNPLVANVPMLPAMYNSYLYHNQPSGFVATDSIQRMQDNAKTYLQKKAAPEVLVALNIQNFRPQVQILREKLINELNFDTLYLDSKAWYTEINEILGAYDKRAPYHQLFGKDFITALERTQIPEAYTKLAEAAFSITEQFNWSEAQTEIVDYLTGKADKRLLNTSGKVAQIYALKNLQKGMQAPDLVLTAHDKEGKQIQNPITISSKDFSKEGYTKTVLVFYQSGCGPCEELMGQLPQYYDKLKSNGIRVISFAADENEQQFNSTATSFPWKDKYCDFKGIKGVNFKNYAVVGTPTIYILDKNGKIEAKLASMSEIVAFVFKS